MKSFEEIQAASKEGFEALTASTAALTKGYQAVATEIADFSKKSFEKSASQWEKAVAAGSFDKAFEIQQAFAKENFDATVAEFTKLGELYAAAAKSAFKPYDASADAVDVKPTEASVAPVNVKPYETSVAAVDVKPNEASVAAVGVKARVTK